MKEFYKRFFYVPEHGAVTERVFITRIVVSITVIICCLAAMSLSAYAFFTSSVNSGNSVATAANFSLDITPVQTVDEPTDGAYSLDNSQSDADMSYSFTLSRATTATARTGYCKIVIITDTETKQEFYTKNVGYILENDEIIPDKTRTITVLVKAGKTAKVSFVSQWGTCNDSLVFDEANIVTPQFAPSVPSSAQTDMNESPEVVSQDPVLDEESDIDSEEEPEQTELNNTEQ